VQAVRLDAGSKRVWRDKAREPVRHGRKPKVRHCRHGNRTDVTAAGGLLAVLVVVVIGLGLIAMIGVVVRAVIMVGMLVMMPVRGWPGSRMAGVAAVELQVAGVGRAVERERQRSQ